MLPAINWLEATRDPECLPCRMRGVDPVPAMQRVFDNSQRCVCGVRFDRPVKFCPECGAKQGAEEAGTTVTFECPTCNAKRGPYRLVEPAMLTQAPLPPPGIIEPTPEEVAAVTELKPSRPEIQLVAALPPKPIEPITVAELAAFINTNFPEELVVNGIKMDRRTDRKSQDGVVGMEVGYWIINPPPVTKICQEVLWCEEGEPKVDEVMAFLQKQAEDILSPNRPIRKIMPQPSRLSVAVSENGQRLAPIQSPGATGVSEDTGDGSAGLGDYLRSRKW